MYQYVVDNVEALAEICEGNAWTALSSHQLGELLSGRIGIILGRYSFPVYLLHSLVIFSVGSYAFVRLFPIVGYAGAAGTAIVTTIIVTFFVAWPLVLFEAKWLILISSVADKFTASFVPSKISPNQ